MSNVIKLFPDDIVNDAFLQQFFNHQNFELERCRLMEWLLNVTADTEENLSRFLTSKGELFHMELLEGPADYQLLHDVLELQKANWKLQQTVFAKMAKKGSA